MGASLAGLFTLGELIGFYVAFDLAVSAIVWIIAAPILSIFALPFSLFHLLRRCRVAYAVETFTNGLLDVLASAGKILIQICKSLRPSAFINRFFAWRRQIRQQRADLKLLQIEADARQEMEAFKHDARCTQYKTEIEHMVKLDASYHKAIEDCLNRLFEDIRITHNNLGDETRKYITGRIGEQIETRVKPVAEDIISNSASVLTAFLEEIRSVGGYHSSAAPKQNLFRNGHARSPEDRI